MYPQQYGGRVLRIPKEPPYIHIIENNTWCLEIPDLFRESSDISRVSAANELDIMFNTRNKSGISKHPCIFLFII
jgi:hypothetical protein